MASRQSTAEVNAERDLVVLTMSVCLALIGGSS
jgi:hypothetical protein